MTDYFQTFLLEYLEAAELISVLLNILISILGVFPSAPLTFVNVKLFGFWNGFLLSFIGEVLGVALSFWLYRKGFRTLVHTKTPSHSKWLKLLHLQGKESFLLILSLRLLPFVPSGLITFFSAVGRSSFVVFIFASALGKIPALFIEVYSVYHIAQESLQGKVILLVLSITLLFYISKKWKKKA
ncbi:TVP38/TMEM64 family protein [Priestia megaterium]